MCFSVASLILIIRRIMVVITAESCCLAFNTNYLSSLNISRRNQLFQVIKTSETSYCSLLCNSIFNKFWVSANSLLTKNRFVYEELEVWACWHCDILMDKTALRRGGQRKRGSQTNRSASCYVFPTLWPCFLSTKRLFYVPNSETTECSIVGT